MRWHRIAPCMRAPSRVLSAPCVLLTLVHDDVRESETVRDPPRGDHAGLVGRDHELVATKSTGGRSTTTPPQAPTHPRRHTRAASDVELPVLQHLPMNALPLLLRPVEAHG